MQTEQTAFLLHRRPYRENQFLVDLLTQDEGKVGAVVYVSHSGKSNKKALLQPFLPLSVQYKGRNALKQLSTVEAIGSSYHYQGTILYSALYLNEISQRLLPELVPCSTLFQHYQDSLHLLLQLQKDASSLQNIDQAQLELTLRQYELVLLEELGLAFDFDALHSSDEDYFYFTLEHGFIGVETYSDAMLYQATPVAKGKPYYRKDLLLAIAQGSYNNTEVMACFKRLMRVCLNELLGGQELHSRKLFKSY